MARKPKNQGTGAPPPKHGDLLDPIIEGLIKRLPKSGAEWPEADRRNWLAMLEQAFKVVYEEPEPEGPITSHPVPRPPGTP